MRDEAERTKGMMWMNRSHRQKVFGEEGGSRMRKRSGGGETEFGGRADMKQLRKPQITHTSNCTHTQTVNYFINKA